MVIAIYSALLPICSFFMCIFGFLVGRCSRKIPILDNNLPRALYRGQALPKCSQIIKEPVADTTQCHDESLRIIGATNRCRNLIPIL